MKDNIKHLESSWINRSKEAKDKYIAKLEAENQQLRKELSQLQAMMYEKK